MAYVAPRAYQEYTDIVEIAFGYTSASDLTTAVWTDVSRFVRGTITITKGKANLANVADPTQINLTLENDGRFTAGNPMSPYWPNVVRNVPIRIRRTWQGAGGTYERATAFVNGWPLTPVAGVAYVQVDIVATGRLRRLRRTGKIVSSALKRSIGTVSNLRAYWPMEDGSTVTASTPTVGLSPLRVFTGTPVFGAEGPPGGNGAVDFTTNLVMRGAVAGGSASSWRVMFAWAFTGTSGDVYPMSWVCADGSMFVPRFVAGGGVFTLNLDYVTPSGTFTQAFACPWSNTDQTWHFFQITAVQNGADVDIAVAYDDVVWHPSTPTAILTGTTLSAVRSIRPGGYAGTALPPSYAFSLAHVAVASPSALNPSLTGPDLAGAVLGYAGEDAVTRAARLCAENGIPITTVAGTVPAQVMGPQSVETLASLLAECEDVDNGLLHDGGPLGNLVYVSGTALYNASAQFTLDYRRGQIGDGYAGTLDDQDLVNVWQISRTNGGSATSTGAASLAIDDEYDQQASPNVATDAQLQPIADWRTHVSSYEAMRFPLAPIDLRRSPELALPATAMSLPARINPVNVPPPYPPAGSMDQFGIGYTEILDAVTWQIAFNCTPYLPYRIAVIQDATNPWVIDADGSTCNNATATATSLTVATPSAPLWSTAGADYPRDIGINGEQVTVTAVTGSSSPQTFTVKRSINGVVKAISGNPAVTLWHPAAIAL